MTQVDTEKFRLRHFVENRLQRFIFYNQARFERFDLGVVCGVQNRSVGYPQVLP